MDKIQMLSNFAILKILGKGSFGEAVLGFSLTKNELFAIKKLELFKYTDDKLLKQLDSEVEALRKFIHPFLMRHEEEFRT